MAIHTTFSSARRHLAELWDEAERSNDVVIISRPGHEDMVLLSRSELDSIEATAHLLRSPRNARRLLSALDAAREGDGIPFDPAALRNEFDLNEPVA
jgi:antitoxin YefM